MTFNQRDIYHLFDSPVPYKGLMLYPVLLKNYIELNLLSSCLMLEKNSIPDAKIISMTYLEYLFYINDEKTNMVTLLDALLRLVLNKKDQPYEINYLEHGDADGRPVFTIGNVKYNSDDFDEIKKIIAEQNLLELPDETIQKTVRDNIEEARRYKEKLRGTKIASFEDQIVALAIYTGWDLDTIYSMTVRKFIKAIRRSNHILHQKIYLQASMSGMVEFKDKSVLQGWLADLEGGDKNSDVTMNLNELQSKADFSSAKT